MLVTDIDELFLIKLASLKQPQIAVLRHDIGVDALPAQTFDLIHARLVFIRVRAREQALERLVTALKPGGWLVLEEYDVKLFDQMYSTKDETARALFRKLRAVQDQLLEEHGTALAWGRHLYQCFRALGLTSVGLDGSLAVWDGGSPGARLI